MSVRAHCGPVGGALAALHLAGQGYAPMRPNALGPASWAPLLARCGDGADAVQPGLGAELQLALDRILPAWPTDLPRGHIHADLFPDNVFFLDGRLSGLIDFYFAATDLLAYDLAVVPERLVLRARFFTFKHHQGDSALLACLRC